MRRLFSIGMLLILVLLLVGTWYATSPRRISRLAETLLSNVLGGKVSVKTGHLSLSGTLLLSGVQVQTDGGAAGVAPLPLFSAEQIEARFDWVSLFAGELRATQLTAIRPTLYLVEDKETDRWNYEMLRKGAATKPAAGGGPSKRAPLPVIVLRDARVQWGEFEKGALKDTAHAVIDGQLTPTAANPLTYRFQLMERPGEGEASLSPTGAAEVSVSGTWDLADNRFMAATQEIVLSDALRDVLPRQVRNWWNEHHLRGRFAQLWITFDNETGMVVGADLDRVSMEMQATPREGGETYPVNISDVRGSLRFGVSKPSVTANIRGRLLGFDFTADGAIAGADPDSPFDLHIRFPSAVLGEDYPPLFLAFPGSQDLMQRIAPHGKFDVSIAVKRLAGTKNMLLDGNILCEDARMRFGPFPYPLEHVKGHVRFNESSVIFDNVTANADENLVHIDGTTGTTPANKAIDFRVWSDDATFDDRLGACLPGEFKVVWDQFVLKARGKFNCVVKRPADAEGNKAPDIHVDLTLVDGSGYPRALPYRFSHAHGDFVLTADQTQVKGFQIACGSDGSGTVNFEGLIHHPGGDVSNLMPDLSVKANIPIDDALINAIPAEYSQKVQDVDLAGRLGFDGIFQRMPREGVALKRGDAAPLDVSGMVTLQGGLVKTHDGRIDLREIAAAAQLMNSHLDIEGASARVPGGLQLTANGAVDFAQSTGRLNLGAHGRDVSLPGEAPAIFPADARAQWNAYKPVGKIDIDANAAIHVGKDNSGVDAYSCTLVPKGISVSNSSWPATVHDINGVIAASPGKIAIQQMTAQTGPVSLICDGTFHSNSGACDLHGSATSDGLPGEWTQKLPASVGKFLADHKTTGQFRLSIDSLQRDGSDKPWNFDAELAVRDLAMDGSLNIAADRVTFATKGTLNSGAFDFEGMLNGTNVGFSGKTLDTLQAGVKMASKEQTLVISDIDGKVAGGIVQGTVTAHLAGKAENSTAGDSGYEANLMLHDAELSRLMLPRTATPEDRKRIGEGRVTATIAVQETFGEHPDRTGRGELVIQDGKIYNVPLAMGLMQLVTLRLPVARAFDHAAMSYYLRDNKVTFEKILLESPSINLAGAGTMSLKDKGLNLNFVTESPNELRLPVISTIINQIRAELLQLAVTGTVDEPKITPVPLSPIASSLRALLPHHAAASE